MTHTIWACTGCMLEHHYPSEGEGTGKEWRNYAGAKMGSITAGILCDKGENHYREDSEEHSTECEYIGFTWTACDGCGSTLGGSRHAFTVWED